MTRADVVGKLSEAATWGASNSVEAYDYTCAYCDREVSSSLAVTLKAKSGARIALIYECPRCHCPTLAFVIRVPHGERISAHHPTASFGKTTEHAPADLKTLYNDARACYGAGSFTATAMLCRKLLMNVAVEQGAKTDQSFKHYVEYLMANHFVPPNSVGWVNHIKDKGNEANHEIAFSSKEDAELLIKFSWSLLYFIFDMVAQPV